MCRRHQIDIIRAFFLKPKEHRCKLLHAHRLSDASLSDHAVLAEHTPQRAAAEKYRTAAEARTQLEQRWQWVSALAATAGGTLTSKQKIKLEAYIQMNYLDRILRHANTRLMQMTAGQYELERIGAENQRSQSGLDLGIIDHYNGTRRSVKTLSGGESFKASLALALGLSDEVQSAAGGIRNIRKEIADTAKLAKELSIGEPTLLDIVSELEKPARDPREEMPKPILRTDVLEMKDLKPGMILKGTVRNVIDFGAFVDIGVHQDGLVHVSQMTDRYIKHPLEAVSVGDIVEVKVLAVDVAKKRISLTMKIRETK